MSDTNPYAVGVNEILMKKFTGADPMSIKPQVIEVNLYQSIFSPILKASLLVNDYVNLLNNYPMVGEETITLQLSQRSPVSPNDILKFDCEFIISGITDIRTNDNARQLLYKIDLVSKEAFNNAKLRVSHAYYDSVENIIQSIITDYLKSDKNLILFSDTKKTRKFVVPNIAPFNAINWISKYAVSSDVANYYTYLFYEVLNGVKNDSYASDFRQSRVSGTSPNFLFKPLQKNTYQGLVDDAAKAESEKNPYFFVSNLEGIRSNQEIYKVLQGKGFTEYRAITGLKFNKRYSSLEKIIGGYFESEYIEVNMLQKDHKVTSFNINNLKNSLYPNKLNTDKYVSDIVDYDTRRETSGRLRYIINNFDDDSQPSLRDKFGSAAASYLAYNSIDLSVGIPTNLELRPGDLFFAHIPEFHGYNEVEDDKYISGHYIISEIKNVIRMTGETSTLLRINRDSLTNPINDQSLYNLSSQSPGFGSK